MVQYPGPIWQGEESNPAVLVAVSGHFQGMVCELIRVGLIGSHVEGFLARPVLPI